MSSPGGVIVELFGTMQNVRQTQTQIQTVGITGNDYDATSMGMQIVCSDGGLGGE